MAERSFWAPRGNLIAGDFVLPQHPGGEIRVEEPGDLTIEHEPFPFDRVSIDQAVEAARRAYPAWRDTPFEARAELLGRLGEAIRSEHERLSELISREVGKPLWEARTEVDAMLGKIPATLGDGMALVAEQSSELGPGRRARSRAHARGVLAVLGPFNFPGHLVHGHVVPALATGNTLVIKPSDATPAVGQLYAELLARAGFPPGVVNVVQGDGASGAALAAHPGLQGVLFTGSWAVGRSILAATLDQPWKLVALEMGGKNGVIVAEDADLDAAAYAIAFGCCVTSGQRCSATSRVIALRSVADALADRLVHLFSNIQVGAPEDPDAFMGPLISAAARVRHADVHDWAVSDGSVTLVEGGPISGPRRGHYVRPSLHRVHTFHPASRYQAEEHFVPDAHLLAVSSLDEAIAALDGTDYGLVGSVFSRDRAVFERVWREISLGLLNWNTSTVGASGKLPFGGVRKSGNDRAAGVTSTLYCTYPVASVECETASVGEHPGFPELP